MDEEAKRWQKEGRDGTTGVPTTSFSDSDYTGFEAMRPSQWREIGCGAQILRDLGVASIRNPPICKATFYRLYQ